MVTSIYLVIQDKFLSHHISNYVAIYDTLIKKPDVYTVKF